MQGRVSLGIDTSCYTTSVACTDKRSIVFEKRTMLSVPFGNRGLRQSEGLFQHVKQLSPLLCELFETVDASRVAAVAVSASPTSRKDSYMPVFLAGLKQAETLAAALHVPLNRVDHQRRAVRKRNAAGTRTLSCGAYQRRNDGRFARGAASGRTVSD